MSALGHMPARFRGLQKNAADDVVLKLVEGVTKHRCKKYEL